jgi:hypothetical protein
VRPVRAARRFIEPGPGAARASIAPSADARLTALGAPSQVMDR